MNPGRTPSVLVVHGDPQVRAVFEIALMRRGAASICVATFEEARRILGGPIDLVAILTDRHLPDGSGLDLLVDSYETFGSGVHLAMVSSDTLLESSEVAIAERIRATVCLGALGHRDVDVLLSRIIIKTLV